MAVREIHEPAIDPRRLGSLIGENVAAAFVERATDQATRRLGGASLFNVNSTATGGGVAEMLHVLISYARGAGVDARWLVIDGDPDFFAITKRIHNHLYGQSGDGGPLGQAEHAHYEAVQHRNAVDLTGLTRAGDVVILHDPQTAGLAAPLRAHGVTVVWRCHVGVDHQDQHSRRGWSFLRRYLEPPSADAYVFSRRQFAPTWLPNRLVTVIPPSIDPFSPKNTDLDDDQAAHILASVGLLRSETPEPATFTRADGSTGRIDRGADVISNGPPPPPDTPLVVQVSRWDHLKDMVGVMHGFAELLARDHGAHLVLAGPTVDGVADDPEETQVLDECWQAWRALPESARSRVTLACLPMGDLEENAIVVNALQRRASIVVQKSLAEGFGLTVAEAMFKGTPVIGSEVGGIADQIVDGVTGRLISDPTDLDAFGAAVLELLEDPARGDAMGRAGRQRVIDEYLPNRHLTRWVDLLDSLPGGH